MSEEIFIREIKETPAVSDTPFAMAILDDKGEIVAYGPYHEDFARYVLHIPLYTKPQLKPLTDEEIAALKKEYIDVELFDEGDYGMEYNTYGVEALIRAVEKRHGIEPKDRIG
jgi:hypothetical protein